MSKARYIVILFMGLIAVSFGAIFAKVIDATPFVIAVWRLGIASVIYYGVMRVRSGALRTALTRSQWIIALISGLFLAIHFTTWFISLKHTSVASSVLLVDTAPIFVALGGYLILKEKPTLLMIVGMGIALIGVVLISSLDFASEQSTLFGNLMAICGAIGAAGYILAGRRLRAEMSTLHYVTAVYSVCAVMLLAAVIIIGDPLFGHDAKNYLYLFGIALIPQTIGHTTLNWSLKYFSATTISVLLLGEPIVATLLAWILLGEQIGGMNVAGGLVIIAGLAIVLRGEMKRRGEVI